jgi:hypothetical protein
MLETILFVTAIVIAVVVVCDRVVAQFFAKKIDEKDLSPAERDLRDKATELEKLELEYEVSQELGQTEEDLKELADKIVLAREEVDKADKDVGDS